MKLNKKETIKFTGFALVVLALLVTGHALHLEDNVSVESLREGLSKTGGWQYVIFFSIYCVAALVPFPTEVLSSAAGALWGAYIGTGITVFSATIASCLPFMMASFMARNAVRNAMEKSNGVSRCDRFAGKNGFITVLIMRLIPFFPWDMVNYLSGLCSIRFRDYLLGSLLGTIPASFTYNLIGASMGGSVNKTAVAIAATVTIFLAVVIMIIKKSSGSREPSEI